MFLLFADGAVCIMIREVAQEPYSHGEDKDDAAHLLKILFSLLPCVPEYRFCGRHTVRRKLHHERKVVVLEEHAQHLGGKDSQDDAECIQSQKHQAGTTGEEGPGNKHIYRHTSGT